jgi:outer membrane protein OmpA-like peptidoglycan-associated protein
LVAQDGLLLQGEGDARMILVRGVEAEGGDAPPVFQATWRFAGADTDPVMALQRTTLTDPSVQVDLDELLLAGFGAYLDVHLHFGKEGVNADLPAEVMVLQLNGMVRAATEELGEAGPPVAVSQPTLEQMQRLCAIDWSKARFGIDAGDGQDKYLAIYRYVRAQRDELERQLRADLLSLAAVHVLQEAEPSPPIGNSASAATVCGAVYDDNNFLCALDLAVSDTLLAIPDVRLEQRLFARPESPVAEVPTMKVRKRDRWLKAELDRLNERIEESDQRRELWALRDRIEDLEGRMDDLALEMQDMQAPAEANPIAELSRLNGANVTVRFPKGGTELDTDARIMLNEVFEQLARDGAQRILVTGYSDATGDPALNLRLSERRANAVRDHLLQRGVDPSRVLVNYYGDSRSAGEDPLERRVEIEWVP